MRSALLIPCLAAGLLARPARAATAYVPADYTASLESAHALGAADHVLTIQKITAAVENMNTGKVTVNSVTQVLDCKTGKLLSQSHCDPCEFNSAQWPKRPTKGWFVERSWPHGASVARAQAIAQIKHFSRFFKLKKADGTEHEGFSYAFWSFDGRRGTPLVDPEARPVAVVGKAPEPKKIKLGPVQKIEIFNGPDRRDTLDYPQDGRSLQLTAVAYASPKGQSTLSTTQRFSPMWSSSCASLSSKSAKQIIFSLNPGVQRCNLHLYEGRTGVEDSVTVRRAKLKPKTRVAISFEGGREAEGVALTGNIRSVEIEAHAFNPDGTPLKNFRPEWNVEGGQVEFLDGETHLRMKVQINKGVSRCEVSLRDAESGAEDHFLIESR